ncbi:MAG: hypothetical protein VX278_04895 [Myxococcota bacterium]|nr:hypothetical protein [Myxococcota bacterium]
MSLTIIGLTGFLYLHGTAMSNPMPSIPDWVLNPVSEILNSVCGVGASAIPKNHVPILEYQLIAVDNARHEVARQIETKVESMVQRYQPTDAEKAKLVPEAGNVNEKDDLIRMVSKSLHRVPLIQSIPKKIELLDSNLYAMVCLDANAYSWDVDEARLPPKMQQPKPNLNDISPQDVLSNVAQLYQRPLQKHSFENSSLPFGVNANVTVDQTHRFARIESYVPIRHKGDRALHADFTELDNKKEEHTMDTSKTNGSSERNHAEPFVVCTMQALAQFSSYIEAKMQGMITDNVSEEDLIEEEITHVSKSLTRREFKHAESTAEIQRMIKTYYQETDKKGSHTFESNHSIVHKLLLPESIFNSPAIFSGTTVSTNMDETQVAQSGLLKLSDGERTSFSPTAGELYQYWGFLHSLGFQVEKVGLHEDVLTCSLRMHFK